jgi:hypothetical protein
MDILYKSLLTRLKDNIPELIWIDEETGQLETPEESYPVQFPCALINIREIDWDSLGKNTQTGDVIIEFRIGFYILEDTHKDAPDMDTALTRLKLLNKIHKYLHCFGGFILPVPGHANTFYDSHFKKLIRIRTTSEKRQDGLRVYNMEYKSNMKDINAVLELVPSDHTPTIHVHPTP